MHVVVVAIQINKLLYEDMKPMTSKFDREDWKW
jgi:hypothetical protein